MKTLAVQFLDQGFHRVLFDAMPMPVFVVDSDVSILEYNRAAAAFIGEQKKRVLMRRSGEVLHCIHATEDARGCGHSAACSECVIRKSVRAALKGRSVTRQRAKFTVQKKTKRQNVTLRVTSQPINYQEHKFVLLVLEGLAE